MTDDISIRWVTPDTAEADAPPLLRLMQGLARFEAWEQFISITEDELARRLALADPSMRAVVAESDGRLHGFATVFDVPFSFSNKPSLELEMLYVEQDWRGRGIGQALMEAVFEFAETGGYERLDWNVLKHNAKAQRFYKRLGGAEQAQWQRWRKGF